MIKAIDEFNETYLDELIQNKVQENKFIEYKTQLPKNTDGDKKEYLADVSSFANAAGGYLVYGMKAENGVPIEIVGLSTDNLDQEIRRLDSLLQDGLDPRMPRYNLKTIEVKDGKIVIVIHTPASWQQPHMVAYQGHFKFYSRNNAGKYRLDVDELRAAFTNSLELSVRIRRFRAERLAKIVSGQSPIHLRSGTLVALHISPIRPEGRYDIIPISNHPERFKPIGTGGWDTRFNLDVFMSYNDNGYSLLFQNGIVEAVDTSIIREGLKSIPSTACEVLVAQSLDRYLKIQRSLGVDTPLVVMLSIMNVKGFQLGVRTGLSSNVGFAEIDRNDLILPEVLLNDFDTAAIEVMRPIYDTLWNAAGWPRSMDYDEAGNFIRQD